jgi:hypothetical protein
MSEARPPIRTSALQLDGIDAVAKSPPTTPSRPTKRHYCSGRVAQWQRQANDPGMREDDPFNPHSPDDALSFGTDGAIQI